MKKPTLLFIIVIFIASFFRLFRLTNLPPSLYYDEVDAGYQAMVFNRDLSDYYGNKFPFHFHSFGDYRTPLHIYSIALFQHITNDPDLSVRLPSAVYGILSVVIVILITGSVIPGFLLAISPWAIHYSRIGFEASGLIFCLLLGIYFWLKFINKNRFLFLIPSVIFFCSTLYFYSTANLFLPILGLILFIVWFPKIIRIRPKFIIFGLIFCLIFLTPQIIDTLNGKNGFRFSYIGIFTLPHREQVVDTLRYQDALTDHPDELGISTTLISSVFHNKYQLVLERFITNYVSSFSSDFLFLKGDNNARHGFGGHGLLYLIDFIFIVVGIFSYFSSDRHNRLSALFFWLLVLAPIPYALTRDTDTPHATRLILMLPSIIYFSYLGIRHFLKKYPLSVYLIIVLYGLSFFNFWHYYYYHYPQASARDWNTGMKETVISANVYTHNKLVFSDSYSSFVSFFLFYHPYIINPSDSIANHLKQYSDNSFSGQVLDDQYYFGHINWTNLSGFPSDTIYIVPASEYNELHLNSFQTVKYIGKRYLNQESFYLIRSAQNVIQN